MGGTEPLVGIPRMVAREVAHDANSALVGRGGQPGKRLVAAEQLVDLVEPVSVIAMVGARRKERGEVEQVHPEPLEVVEVLSHAVEVAAVELPRRRGALVDRLVIPLGGFGPVGQRPPIGSGRTREAIGKDLVHDRLGSPGRSRRVRDELEVVVVARLDVAEARTAQPDEAPVCVLDREAVAVHGVAHLDLGLPPLCAVALAEQVRL